MATKDELLAQQAQARKAGATPVGLQSQNPYAAPQVSTPSNNQSTLQNLSSQRSFGAGAPAVRVDPNRTTAGMQTMGQQAGIPGPYQRTPVGAVSGGAPPRVASPQQQSNLYTYGMYGPGSGFDPTARYRQADARRTVGQMNRYAQQRALLELAKAKRSAASRGEDWQAPKKTIAPETKNTSNRTMTAQYDGGHEVEVKPGQTAVKSAEDYSSPAEARAAGAHFYTDPETGQLKNVDQYYYEHPEEA